MAGVGTTVEVLEAKFPEFVLHALNRTRLSITILKKSAGICPLAGLFLNLLCAIVFIKLPSNK